MAVFTSITNAKVIWICFFILCSHDNTSIWLAILTHLQRICNATVDEKRLESLYASVFVLFLFLFCISNGTHSASCFKLDNQRLSCQLLYLYFCRILKTTMFGLNYIIEYSKCNIRWEIILYLQLLNANTKDSIDWLNMYLLSTQVKWQIVYWITYSFLFLPMLFLKAMLVFVSCVI